MIPVLILVCNTCQISSFFSEVHMDLSKTVRISNLLSPSCCFKRFIWGQCIEMTHRNAFVQGKKGKIRCFLLMQQNVLYTDTLFLIFVEHGCEKYAQTLCFTVVGCCYPLQGFRCNNQTKYYSHCCWWFGKRIIFMHFVDKHMVM